MFLLLKYLHLLDFAPHVMRLRVFLLLDQTLKDMAVLKQQRTGFVICVEAGLDNFPRIKQLLPMWLFQGMQICLWWLKQLLLVVIPRLQELTHMFFFLFEQLAHFGIVLSQQRRPLLVVGVVADFFQLCLRVFRLYNHL